MGRQLRHGRWSTERIRQGRCRLVQLDCEFLEPPRHPDGPPFVPEMSLQFADDRGGCVRGEPDLSGGVESVDRVQESDRRHLHEVVDALSPPGEPSCEIVGEWSEPLHQSIPGFEVGQTREPRHDLLVVASERSARWIVTCHRGVGEIRTAIVIVERPSTDERSARSVRPRMIVHESSEPASSDPAGSSAGSTITCASTSSGPTVTRRRECFGAGVGRQQTTARLGNRDTEVVDGVDRRVGS